VLRQGDGSEGEWVRHSCVWLLYSNKPGCLV